MIFSENRFPPSDRVQGHAFPDDALKAMRVFMPRPPVPKRRTSLRRTLAALLGCLIGYLLFAFAGYWIIQLASGNTFDRSMEASMTSVFAIGPLGAVVGLVAGMIIGGKRRLRETPRETKNI
jgi:hypothetical protein